MARTHELGLSFHTAGKAVGQVGFAIYRVAQKLGEVGYDLEHAKWFEQPHFWQVIKIKPGTPLHHTTYAGEIDGDFRYDDNAHVLRFTKRRALVVGSWQPKPSELDEIDMLYRATNLNHEYADAQSTDFETSQSGLSTGAMDLQSIQDSQRPEGADDDPNDIPAYRVVEGDGPLFTSPSVANAGSTLTVVYPDDGESCCGSGCCGS